MANVTEERSDEPKPRSRLRLSVRALMVVVLVLALGLGWVVRGAHVQRDAVASIERTGGKVYYDWKRLPNGKWDVKAQPRWPRWLVDRLGVDYFGNVVIVSLGKQATDAEMAHVGRLSRLESISVQGSVSDAGAVHLRGLVNLDYVHLSYTEVTGACLANLRGLTGLKKFYLAGLAITDADLGQLEGLTGLELLDLNSTPVTDEGLAHLEGLVNLKELRLNSTMVTGPGLLHLKQMSQLYWLTLSQSRVGDLSAIPPLPALRWLILDKTTVGDAELSALSKFTSLGVLGLYGTKVTDAGLSRIRHLRGSLKIILLGDTKVTDACAPDLLRMENLVSLNLARTAVTDATLDQLVGLKSLQALDVSNTAVTPAGLARLKKFLPALKKLVETATAPRPRSTPATPPSGQGTQP